MSACVHARVCESVCVRVSVCVGGHGKVASAVAGARTHDGELITHIISP